MKTVLTVFKHFSKKNLKPVKTCPLCNEADPHWNMALQPIVFRTETDLLKEKKNIKSVTVLCKTMMQNTSFDRFSSSKERERELLGFSTG